MDIIGKEKGEKKHASFLTFVSRWLAKLLIIHASCEVPKDFDQLTIIILMIHGK